MALPKPSGAFEWVQEPWGAALRCAPLAVIAPHCFSTRALRLEGAGEADHGSWDELAQALGVRPGALVRMRQVHCAAVYEPSAGEQQPPSLADWPEADIGVSRDPAVALSIRAADCVPVLLGDARTGAVAAVHAGWRGIAAGAVMVAVQALTQRFHSRPADMVAAVGPSIGPCCYEVGADLLSHFAAHPNASAWFSDELRPRLDLWRATREQLERAGVPASQVHVCALCTVDHPTLFHSYRRDGKLAGRLVAAIRAPGGQRAEGRGMRAEG